jgi:hypothetical protein
MSYSLTRDADASIARRRDDGASRQTTGDPMGDKSPKATHKHAAQKQAKDSAANNKKKQQIAAKQVPRK